MSDYLNVALIGAGNHSSTTLLPTLLHLPVRLQAVVDPQHERADEAAMRFGCRAYTSSAACYAAEQDLDAVLLCAGPSHHPALIAEAVAAGLHVWSEKPAADNAAAIDEIAGTVVDSGKVVVVGYKKAFTPAVDKLRELMTLPEAGTLQQVVAQYPVGRKSAWHANCCHPLACILALAGPVARFRLHCHAGGSGSMSLDFCDGAMGTLVLAQGTRGLSERYQLFSENSHLELEDHRRLHLHRGQRSGENDSWVGEGVDHGTVTWDVQQCYARRWNRLEMVQGFHHEIAYFIDCVQEGRQPQRGNLAFARALTELDEKGAAVDHEDWVDCDSPDWR